MGYGPDNNLPLNEGMAVRLTIPRYAEVQLTFSSSANYENAICIYNADMSKIYEKGNYGRDLNAVVIGRDRTKDRQIVISGWHKNSPPAGGRPWFQSPVRFAPNEPDRFGSGSIGFEDAGDMDYNDITTSYTFQ